MDFILSNLLTKMQYELPWLDSYFLWLLTVNHFDFSLFGRFFILMRAPSASQSLTNTTEMVHRLSGHAIGCSPRHTWLAPRGLWATCLYRCPRCKPIQPSRLPSFIKRLCKVGWCGVGFSQVL